MPSCADRVVGVELQEPGVRRGVPVVGSHPLLRIAGIVEQPLDLLRVNRRASRPPVVAFASVAVTTEARAEHMPSPAGLEGAPAVEALSHLTGAARRARFPKAEPLGDLADAGR